jgi:hypothetical protein
MKPLPIHARRLASQLVSHQRFAAPAQVVAWLGAIQAQDYLAALWALGLRTADASEASIEAAIADGSVIRTHVFRGTWQYVAREDVRWMVALVGARVIAGAASRFGELGLDAKTLERATELFAAALAGGKQLTRKEMAAVLARRRVSIAGGSLLHVLGYAELRGVICSGGRRGKQPTFALLDERAPKARARSREQALAELARRYFQSRGPATERDFAWWTGLPLRDVREALELAKPDLQRVELGGVVYWSGDDAVAAPRRSSAHLIPAFDEVLIGYQDRSALVDAAHVRRINRGGGILKPALVLDDRVQGTWTRTIEKGAVSIVVVPFRDVSDRERARIVAAAERYAAFVGLPATVEVVAPTAAS